MFTGRLNPTVIYRRGYPPSHVTHLTDRHATHTLCGRRIGERWQPVPAEEATCQRCIRMAADWR